VFHHRAGPPTDSTAGRGPAERGYGSTARSTAKAADGRGLLGTVLDGQRRLTGTDGTALDGDGRRGATLQGGGWGFESPRLHPF
jgi:hypothetical protein